MKILWSLEPFHQDKARLQGMHRYLLQVAKDSKNILAAFIVTRTEPELVLAYDIPEKERFSKYPLSFIKKLFLKSAIIFDEKNIIVKDDPNLSVSGSVDSLLKIADEKKVDLLALYTHSRKGFFNFLIGSFAETLIHKSKKNILLMSPKSKIKKKINKIVYGTDLGLLSKKHLKTVIDISQNLECELIIVHHFSSVIMKKGHNVDNLKKRFEQDCKKANLKYKFIVNDSFSSTAKVLQKIADQEGAEVIAVSSKVGPMASLMGGSVTRQLVKENDDAILIIK